MEKKPPPGYVPIYGDIVEDGRVVPRRPIPRPAPKKPPAKSTPKA